MFPTMTFMENKKIVSKFVYDGLTPLEAGERLRRDIDLIRPAINATFQNNKTNQSSLIFSGNGEYDFGDTLTLLFPPCDVITPIEEPHTKFITHCKIDPIYDGAGNMLKNKSTAGFTLSSYNFFNNCYFGGNCSNPNEDGGLLGWGPDMNDQPGRVMFTHCNIDASQGMDWGIYSWSNADRSVSIFGGTYRYCRLLVAMAASGGRANQTINIQDSILMGNANGSRSIGATSEQRKKDKEGKPITPDKHGILSAALNRRGSTRLSGCSASAVGLREEYSEHFGCPRIACLCTNQYSDKHGTTEFLIEKCESRIIGGTAKEVNDYDIRGLDTGLSRLTIIYPAEEITNLKEELKTKIVDKMGGSNPDGTMKGYVAPSLPPITKE